MKGCPNERTGPSNYCTALDAATARCLNDPCPRRGASERERSADDFL
jgi:hypothetical protein